MKGSEEMTEEMTNKQFDNNLELIAKLVESEAKTVEEAVKIIRDAKIEK